MSHADQNPPGAQLSPPRRDDRLSGSVVVVAFVLAISGLLYGYDTGIIYGALF